MHEISFAKHQVTWDDGGTIGCDSRGPPKHGAGLFRLTNVHEDH